MRATVSVVCVFNNIDVLTSTLERSIAEGLADAPQVELIPVDNRDGTFKTAGAALNHGARQAHNDVVVFVHQDVFLHSLAEVEAVAGTLLRTPAFGVIGAVGVDHRGKIIGRIRDRVVPLGEPAPRPRDVETLDEVLFMITREQVWAEPLADDPQLGWHAYAVEYSLRMRRIGRRVVVMDVPLTHNSLTINMRNLPVAHRRVGDRYPALLPIMTTCGVVKRADASRDPYGFSRRVRGGLSFAHESLAAFAVRRAAGNGQVVLADIRVLADDAVRLAGLRSLRSLDIRTAGASPIGSVDKLDRLGRSYSASTVTGADVSTEIENRPADTLLLLAGMTAADVGAVCHRLDIPSVVGLSEAAGIWLLIGASPPDLAELWRRRRNRPFAGLLPMNRPAQQSARPKGCLRAMASNTRLAAWASEGFFGTVVSATDLLPPGLRYGYAHRMTRMLFGDELPRVPAALGNAVDTDPSPAAAGASRTCVLATFALDVGGIGAVIEMLASRLSAHGVRPVVVCEGEGQRTRRLRKLGVEVISVDGPRSAAEALRSAAADVVELHSAPPYLERAAIDSGLPLVPVLHNTEIHFTSARWRSFAVLVQRSTAAVAVSEVVREFHVRHVPSRLSDKFTVISNGASAFPIPDVHRRARARQALERTLGVQLGQSIVFVSLARYDAQKNISGLVAGFLRAVASSDQPIHLVLAGEPGDWAEVRRASSIRRSSPVGDRVHLLANSDARTLLAAGDIFILNSFFEGWPVAATEAAVAGLPLLLSDVGGARELVACDPRSVLIPNACGPASEVTDRRVAAARRRSRHQSNHDELITAIHAMAAAMRSEDFGEARSRSANEAALAASLDAMAAAHARVMQAAVEH